MLPQDGRTALMAAAEGRHREGVETQLGWSADEEAADRVSQARRMPLRVRTERARCGRAVDCDGDRGCVMAG